MSACERYEADLSALLDGELDAAKEEELRAHMAVCPECRELYETFSLLHKDAQEPPAALAAGIMAAVRAEAAGTGKVTQMPKPKSHWKPWLAAAACFVVIVGAVSIPRLLSQRPSEPVTPSVRTMPQPDESAAPETTPVVTPSAAPTASPAVTPDGSGNAWTPSKNHSGGSGSAPVVTPAPTPTPIPTPVVTASGTDETPPPDRQDPSPSDAPDEPVTISDPDSIDKLKDLLGPATPVDAPSWTKLPILVIREQERTLLAVYLDGADVIYTTDGEQFYRCADAAESLIKYLAQP